MQPQSFVLLRGQLEHEVGREAFLISSHLLVESFDRYPIKFGKVGIEKHSLASQERAKATVDANQVMLTSVYVPYTWRKASQISPTVA